MDLNEFIDKLVKLRDYIGGNPSVLIETKDGGIFEPETITFEYDPESWKAGAIIKTDY
jgi:hypothetical protein